MRSRVWKYEVILRARRKIKIMGVFPAEYPDKWVYDKKEDFDYCIKWLKWAFKQEGMFEKMYGTHLDKFKIVTKISKEIRLRK